MPDLGLLLVVAEDLWCLDGQGELQPFSINQQADTGWLCLNPESLVRQFDCKREDLVDLGELWTFIYPTSAPPRQLFALLTVLDLSLLAKDHSPEEALMAFRTALHHLLDLAKDVASQGINRSILAYLYESYWPFATSICARLGMDVVECKALGTESALLSAIQVVEKWPEHPLQGRGDLGKGISEDEALQAFRRNLPLDAETRPAQQAYARAAQYVFSARSSAVQENESAHIALLQAGTGIGKTLAYLASAQLWAARNDEPVWITTYSRHLQDQIATEVKRQGHGGEMVVRKGRENYLCLLNFDEILRGQFGLVPEQRVLLALVARWIIASQSGIMVGDDFPLWLEERLENRLYYGLRLKQGECLYRACGHYSRCFLESATRKSAEAKLVIANHALTLRLAAKGQLQSSRIIVDEAHQLFDATDSATIVRLGLAEVQDVQRWLVGGAKNNRKRVRRGLAQRFSGLMVGDAVNEALRDVQSSCAIFADHEGREARLLEGEGVGTLELFFQAIIAQFPKNSDTPSYGYTEELALGEVKDTTLLALTAKVHQEFQRLSLALKRLVLTLEDDFHGDEEDIHLKNQLLSIKSIIEEYPLAQLEGWLYLLARLQEGAATADNAKLSVIERLYIQPKTVKRAFDTGVEMAFLDPSEILQDWLYSAPQKAVLLTSASLEIEQNHQDMPFAFRRTGLAPLVPNMAGRNKIMTGQFVSPFDYPRKAMAFLVTDIDPKNEKAVNVAMQSLFIASQGGALGLFTAIRRARLTFRSIHTPLREKGITVYSQHDDSAGNMFLAECMRENRDACLIATDAFRDGVDIPGEALRLVVQERIPWAQPHLLHRHRRQHFGREYDQEIARQRLQQAFGRLIRTANDWGSFVIFGNNMPTTLQDALPIPIKPSTLAEAVEAVAAQNHSNINT